MPRIEGTKVGVTSDGRDVYAPLIIIAIHVGGCLAQGPAIIDSGADGTVIPIEALVGCGVAWDSLSNGVMGQGAGGAFERRPLDARVQFREWTICERIQVAAPGSLPAALLGREDFFAKFVIRFNWHKSPPEVLIDPVADSRRSGAAGRH